MEPLVNLVKLITDTALSLRSACKMISPKDKGRLGRGFLSIYRSVSQMSSNVRTIASILEELLIATTENLSDDDREAWRTKYQNLRMESWNTSKDPKSADEQYQAALVNFKMEAVSQIVGPRGLELLAQLDESMEKQADEIEHYLKLLQSSGIPWVALASLFDPKLERYLEEGFTYTRYLHEYYLFPYNPRAPKDVEKVLNLLNKASSDIGVPGVLSDTIQSTANAAKSFNEQTDFLQAVLYGHELALLKFIYEGIGHFEGKRAAFRVFISSHFDIDMLV